MLVIVIFAILALALVPASGQVPNFMNRYMPQNNFVAMDAAQRNFADMNRQAQAQARYHFVNADMNRPPQHYPAKADKPRGLMRDDQIKGGKALRDYDVEWSQKYGGYRSEEPGKTLYGKYAEPALHALEHLRRAIADRNPVELARARDEIKTVGKGLHTVEHKHLRAAVMKIIEDAKKERQ